MLTPRFSCVNRHHACKRRYGGIYVHEILTTFEQICDRYYSQPKCLFTISFVDTWRFKSTIRCSTTDKNADYAIFIGPLRPRHVSSYRYICRFCHFYRVTAAPACLFLPIKLPFLPFLSGRCGPAMSFPTDKTAVFAVFIGSLRPRHVFSYR